MSHLSPVFCPVVSAHRHSSPITRLGRSSYYLLSVVKGVGEIKYPLVSKVVKASLALSHGNAEVERGFSSSGRTMTDDKSSMSERTLNSIMTVKSALKTYKNKPELVPISKELLVFARSAYKRYEIYLDEQKKILQEKELEKKNAEERKVREEENKQKLIKKKSDIKKYEETLKQKRKEEEMKRKIGDKLFSEATDRLKQGIQRKDMGEIQLAQAMLHSVVSVREEEGAEKKIADSIQETLEKRKSSLITSFFNKKN